MKLTGFVCSFLLLSLVNQLTSGQLTGTKTCDVNGSGVLTSFIGGQGRIILPCKYRLADFTCGGYRVKVTIGDAPSDFIEEYPFIPVSAWVKITNLATGEFFAVRTSKRRLNKFLKNRVESSWEAKAGTLDEFDFLGYDEELDSLLFQKNGVFTVRLIRTAGAAVACETDDFASTPMPVSLCGDATNPDEIEQGRATLFSEDPNASVEDFLNFVLLNDRTVTQYQHCQPIADAFQSCTKRIEVVTRCDVIFTDESRAQCLVQATPTLDQFFGDCVRAVCDNDPTALEAANDFISNNCEGVDAI